MRARSSAEQLALIIARPRQESVGSGRGQPHTRLLHFGTGELHVDGSLLRLPV